MASGLKSSFIYNAKAGIFKSNTLDSWNESEHYCVNVTMLKLYESQKWLPSSGINFVSEDGTAYLASFRLTVISKETKKISLAFYLHNEIEKTIDIGIVEDSVNLSEKVNFEFYFQKNNALSIIYKNKFYSYNIPFYPKKLVVGGNTSKSKIELINGSCKN